MSSTRTPAQTPTEAQAAGDADFVSWADRGFPTRHIDIRCVAEQNWNLLDGEFTFPIVALKETALQHNIDLMQSFCAEQNVSLAPHLKTTMSPALATRQVAAGAWGVTVANVQQAKVFIEAGFDRILIANEVVARSEIRYIARCRRENPDLEVIVMIDSVDGARLLDAELQYSSPNPSPLPVLLEVGYHGGRAGVRSRDKALNVAAFASRAAFLDLIGIGGFEGLAPGGSRSEQVQVIRQYLEHSSSVLRELCRRGFIAPHTAVASFGGSSFFDEVIAEFRTGWSDGPAPEVILRSGCYVTHDHGLYARTSPLLNRSSGGPQAALELWAFVLSRPASDLAIVGFGRRDASTDIDLPVPLSVRSDGRNRDASRLRVTSVNDQHAFVHVPPHDPLSVGDAVSFGISHPCTTFDKWRLLPVVDDAYRVVDAVRTYF